MELRSTGGHCDQLSTEHGLGQGGDIMCRYNFTKFDDRAYFSLVNDIQYLETNHQSKLKTLNEKQQKIIRNYRTKSLRPIK